MWLMRWVAATYSGSPGGLRVEYEVESEELKAGVGDLMFVSFFLFYNVFLTLTQSNCFILLSTTLDPQTIPPL